LCFNGGKRHGMKTNEVIETGVLLVNRVMNRTGRIGRWLAKIREVANHWRHDGGGGLGASGCESGVAPADAGFPPQSIWRAGFWGPVGVMGGDCAGRASFERGGEGDLPHARLVGTATETGRRLYRTLTSQG